MAKNDQRGQSGQQPGSTSVWATLIGDFPMRSNGLSTGDLNDPTLQKTQNRFTVATLAREAGVGRNAIYTNHRDLLERASSSGLESKSQSGPSAKTNSLNSGIAIEALKLNERRMITENAVLLKRALDSRSPSRSAIANRMLDSSLSVMSAFGRLNRFQKAPVKTVL